VAERLGLEFEQVKKLCGDKLELLKANGKRENGCHMIFKHDNFFVFKQSDQFVVSFNLILEILDKRNLCNCNISAGEEPVPYSK